jgi:hypothetical protein
MGVPVLRWLLLLLFAAAVAAAAEAAAAEAALSSDHFRLHAWGLQLNSGPASRI